MADIRYQISNTMVAPIPDAIQARCCDRTAMLCSKPPKLILGVVGTVLGVAGVTAT